MDPSTPSSSSPCPMSGHTDSSNQQPVMKELTLLLMGETGVGKSTFINNIINVLSFKSLADAEKSEELVSLIPSFFSLANNSLKSKVIRTKGIDNKNERTIVGQSATKSSRIYRIVTDRMILRLIDTPGIGEGLEKDQENMEDILRTIGQVDELNGILILLKPNNSSIGVVFRYCVNELLMQLHRSASANIVFVFTNTRGTFYKPGDTFPGLRKLLEESGIGIPTNKDRVYCFDSESFRYLAAIRHEITFSNELRSAFSQSWDKFAVETTRLLDHISSMIPHDVVNTTSLNNVRQVVVRMIEPLCELMQMIEKTIRNLDQKKAEIENLRENEENLSNAMYMIIESCERRDLGEKFFSCRDPDCREIFNDNGITRKYLKRCHAISEMGFVQKLANWVWKADCRVCGHPYGSHRSYDFGWIQKSEVSVDPDIEARLLNCKTAAEKKEIVIHSIESQISECKAEYKFVQKAAATFALFLKLNAILPFTDTRIEYLDHMIEEEKAKSLISGSNMAVRKLMETRKDYMRELLVMEEAMKSGEGDDARDPRKMQEIESKLCSLRYFGKTFNRLRRAEMKKFKTMAPIINYSIVGNVDSAEEPMDQDLDWLGDE